MCGTCGGWQRKKMPGDLNENGEEDDIDSDGRFV